MNVLNFSKQDTEQYLLNGLRIDCDRFTSQPTIERLAIAYSTICKLRKELAGHGIFEALLEPKTVIAHWINDTLENNLECSRKLGSLFPLAITYQNSLDSVPVEIDGSASFYIEIAKKEPEFGLNLLATLEQYDFLDENYDIVSNAIRTLENHLSALA